jgi:hypothetical protein
MFQVLKTKLCFKLEGLKFESSTTAVRNNKCNSKTFPLPNLHTPYRWVLTPLAKKIHSVILISPNTLNKVLVGLYVGVTGTVSCIFVVAEVIIIHRTIGRFG